MFIIWLINTGYFVGHGLTCVKGNWFGYIRTCLPNPNVWMAPISSKYATMGPRGHALIFYNQILVCV